MWSTRVLAGCSKVGYISTETGGRKDNECYIYTRRTDDTIIQHKVIRDVNLITRVIYDLSHCAYKTAGYNCRFVYKTVSIQRSFVFASGTPTPIVVDLFGESTITVVNKYRTQLSDAKVDKSKGGVQGQNSLFTPVQFTTRICALNLRPIIIIGLRR